MVHRSRPLTAGRSKSHRAPMLLAVAALIISMLVPGIAAQNLDDFVGTSWETNYTPGQPMIFKKHEGKLRFGYVGALSGAWEPMYEVRSWADRKMQLDNIMVGNASETIRVEVVGAKMTGTITLIHPDGADTNPFEGFCNNCPANFGSGSASSPVDVIRSLLNLSTERLLPTLMAAGAALLGLLLGLAAHRSRKPAAPVPDPSTLTSLLRRSAPQTLGLSVVDLTSEEDPEEMTWEEYLRRAQSGPATSGPPGTSGSGGPTHPVGGSSTAPPPVAPPPQPATPPPSNLPIHNPQIAIYSGDDALKILESKGLVVRTADGWKAAGGFPNAAGRNTTFHGRPIGQLTGSGIGWKNRDDGLIDPARIAITVEEGGSAGSPTSTVAAPASGLPPAPAPQGTATPGSLASKPAATASPSPAPVTKPPAIPAPASSTVGLKLVNPVQVQAQHAMNTLASGPKVTTPEEIEALEKVLEYLTDARSVYSKLEPAAREIANEMLMMRAGVPEAVAEQMYRNACDMTAEKWDAFVKAARSGLTP